VRNAALKALRPEVARRLAAIAQAKDESIELTRDARVKVEGLAVAKLAAGAPVLKPRLELIGAEHAAEPQRNAARERLELWLAQRVAHDLRPLAALETAWRDGRLPPDARGLAFRLIENAGALDCAQEDITHLTEVGAAALARYGVRIGAHSIFLPSLIKPGPAHTLSLLWRAANPKTEHALFAPRPGALSTDLAHRRPWGELAAAGYRGCGRIAVRFDQLEKLAEAITSQPQPNDAALARIIGRPARDVAGVLASLGYRRSEQDGAKLWRRVQHARKHKKRAPPKDNAFSALANLLPPAESPPRRKRTQGA
jgi:ATP-dependent RNA helicase SUPV3L1/SUV3